MKDTELQSVDETENIIPNTETPKKSKRIDFAALSWYGETFTGYQKIEEVRDLIPTFKGFYYQQRIKDPNAKITQIVKEFNVSILPRKFHPYQKNISQWKVKWDADILAQYKNQKTEITTEKEIYQVIKTRNDEKALITPDDGALEAGVRTLGGELLNDAFQLLREDQQNPEIYDDEVLVKRRNYIVGVFGHVTKMVQGKAALLLKASEEKRNNAGFLMELLAKATSGKLKPEDMEMLKSNYNNRETVITNG